MNSFHHWRYRHIDICWWGQRSYWNIRVRREGVFFDAWRLSVYFWRLA